MSSSPLTIRNLSPAPISLINLETFTDPHTLQSKAGFFSFASKNTTSSALSSKLVEHAQTFHAQCLSMKLQPWEAYTPKLEPPTSEDDTERETFSKSLAMRLTIENEKANKFRVDVNPTYTQKQWLTFVPLAPNSEDGFKAIYHPSTPESKARLTILDANLPDLSSWMSTLPSTLPISALSIPGTHNSHTHYHALPSVRCQTATVKQQLEHGIRFLDIRVQPSTDVGNRHLALVHGDFPISLTGAKYLAPILDTCYSFLENHPSETLLMSLKREGPGKATDEQLSQILEKHYFSQKRDMWYLNPEIPYLGDVRGKIVLIRRYNLDSSFLKPETASPDQKYFKFGLDATAWPHNSTHATHGPFCVQDYCEIMSPSMIPDKFRYSKEHLARAAACTAFVPGVNTDVKNPIPPGPLHLNFLSGSNFWSVGTWPGKIALHLNQAVEEWLCRGHHLEGEDGEPDRAAEEEDVDVVRRAGQGDGGVGVVAMDEVGMNGDWDLVKLIVGLNRTVSGFVVEKDGSS